jgi:hypothetical protein
MSLGFPNWVLIDNGPNQGCSKIDWGEQWGASIGVLLIVYFVLIPGAVTLSYKGYRVLGMTLYPTLFILGITILGVPWCGLGSKMTGATIAMIANIVFAGLWLLAAVLNSNDVALRRYSPLGYVMNKRIAKPVSAPWANQDLFLLGPINEFLSLSVMEVIGTVVVLFWLAICVYARYLDLMDPTFGFENKIGNSTRAFGRAMSAATLRCLLLTIVSSSRNTIINHFLGIPFERAIKWHKALGRLQLTCMIIHVCAMLAGGTDIGYAWYTKNHNVMEKVQWANTLNMYGQGTNLFAGPIALFFWTLLVIMSLPYFRRQMLEVFYFVHLNLFAAANLFTVFHARASVVPWIVPAVLLFYIDASIRFLAKTTAVEALEIKVIGENMVKLVLRQRGFPLGAFSYHPGSYLWLSCNLRKKVPSAVAAAAAAASNESVAVTDATTDASLNTSGSGYSKVATDAPPPHIELDGIFGNIKVPGGVSFLFVPLFLSSSPISLSSLILSSPLLSSHLAARRVAFLDLVPSHHHQLDGRVWRSDAVHQELWRGNDAVERPIALRGQTRRGRHPLARGHWLPHRRTERRPHDQGAARGPRSRGDVQRRNRRDANDRHPH